MNRNFYYRTVFMVLIVYFAVLINTNLMQFPKPSLRSVMNGTWAAQVEAHLQESIGFHDSLFRLKTQMDMLIGEKMIRDVYITDDMLLQKLTSEHSDDILDSAAVLNQFYAKYQIPSYFILVPSASEIYKDNLPANAVKQDQEVLIQRIYAAVGTGVRCIDAHNILSSQKNEYIYYRTDTHWTSYGAYCVYQSAIQKMGLTAVPYNRYVITHMSTNFKGNLHLRTLYEDVQADVLDCYTYENGAAVTKITAYDAHGGTEDRGAELYDFSRLQSEGMYDFYLGEDSAMLKIQTNLENDRKLLVYKDDFADCFIPFLVQHYSEICVVDLNAASGISEQLTDPADYTQVLFLCSMESWGELW